MTCPAAAVVSALALVAAASCRDAGPKGAFAVRDSAGVQIVSNPNAVRGDSGCVRVDSVPALTIGGPNAEGPYDVQRAWSARRLVDGHIVVLNGATSELRFFDSAGRHVHTVGRKGSGPGEFRSAAGLLRFGPDTLAVYEFGTPRVTLLGGRGELLTTIALQGLSGATLLGRLADGSFIFSAGHMYPPRGANGRRRQPTHLVRVSRDGMVLDTVGTFPGTESYVESDARSVLATLAPFGRGTSFAVEDGRVFVADNAEYRVRVFADGRRLERIVERAHEPVVLSSAEVARQKAERARSISNPLFLARLERSFQRDQLPATLPAHGRIAVDADGWLWVRAYSEAQERDVAWDVFDVSGRLRCALTLPAAFSVREIGHDFLIGVQTDADGVEQVRLHGLRRSAQGSH